MIKIDIAGNIATFDDGEWSFTEDDDELQQHFDDLVDAFEVRPQDGESTMRMIDFLRDAGFDVEVDESNEPDLSGVEF